jgi:hypothetical protein
VRSNSVRDSIASDVQGSQNRKNEQEQKLGKQRQSERIGSFGKDGGKERGNRRDPARFRLKAIPEDAGCWIIYEESSCGYANLVGGRCGVLSGAGINVELRMHDG